MITPFRHPLLEHFGYTDGFRSFLVARERRATSSTMHDTTLRRVDAQTYSDELAACTSWPLDFTLIETGPQTTLTAGQWVTAPLYLTDTVISLQGSWSLRHLRRHLRTDDVNGSALARQLSQQLRYTHQTLWNNVHQLTERATATYDQHGLTITYPTAALRARPRGIREDVDIVAAYESILRDATNERPYRPHDTAVELSGGIDSANVALSLARSHPGQLSSYAIAVEGIAGAQQLSRRQELVDYGGFRDFTIPASSAPPLHPHGDRARGIFVDPAAEPYHELVQAMLCKATEHGVDTVFTGDGGDELLGLRSEEWLALGKTPGRHAWHRQSPPWLTEHTKQYLTAIDDDTAPPSILNEATLMGFACRSPQFLDAGLWPVSPLCQPRLIRFAEQLPVQWRNNKAISRRGLARCGFGPHIVAPPLQENFSHVMESAIRTHGARIIDELLRSGFILVDLGYFDAGALRDTSARMRAGTTAETLIFQTITTELALQSLSTSRAVA
ncbi:MAG: asparagine synthase-related protein [Sciscionella sp.]